MSEPDGRLSRADRPPSERDTVMSEPDGRPSRTDTPPSGDTVMTDPDGRLSRAEADPLPSEPPLPDYAGEVSQARISRAHSAAGSNTSPESIDVTARRKNGCCGWANKYGTSLPA